MIPVFQRETTRTPRSNGRWMRLLALLLLVFASLAAVTGIILKQTSASAVGDDWPTYLHDPQRSSASNDTTISTSNTGQLVKNWTFKTGGVIGSSPTVVGGTVYAGSWDGYEYALDAATGTLKWKTYLGQTSVSVCNPPQAGITSTAAVYRGFTSTVQTASPSRIKSTPNNPANSNCSLNKFPSRTRVERAAFEIGHGPIEPVGSQPPWP